MTKGNHYKAIIIGGGFYGVNIALYMAKINRGPVLLLEQEEHLLSRASYNNQARIHNGYHYPRSFTTAYRSRINLPKFVQDWPSAVHLSFTKLYAIARNSSKVTAKQFERFCNSIGAEIEVSHEYKELFNHRLVEQVFKVQEYAFDAQNLSDWSKEQLEFYKVEVRTNSCVKRVSQSQNSRIAVSYQTLENLINVEGDLVFNCTYSGLNQITGAIEIQAQLKHELTEMALLKVPKPLNDLGITMMDGAFFSLMPFPSRELHTLSHVRYTPHFSWMDKATINPYDILSTYDKTTRFNRMIRDVQRYIPDIVEAEYQDSLFEIKTVLQKNEGNDGRPILFEQSSKLPNLYSVLGGKIDNIYDAIEFLKHNLH